jgi:hypothetical protein
MNKSQNWIENGGSNELPNRQLCKIMPLVGGIVRSPKQEPILLLDRDGLSFVGLNIQAFNATSLQSINAYWMK